MEFVIVSLAEDGVVEGDEAGLDNRSLAVVASVREFLSSAAYKQSLASWEPGENSRHDSPDDNRAFR
jgi:hypothetical protein